MAALTAWVPLAPAQNFPTRPVTLIVPWPAGGSTDVGLRALASATEKHLGQPIVIENRSGASGTLAPGQMAATAKPDGYTITQIPITVFRFPFMVKTTFDPAVDFTYIIGVSGYTFGVVVRDDAPWKTFQEFLADAKANPGKITMASAGVGSAGHLVGELFKMMAGVDFVHVPYRGAGPALADLLGGQVLISFAGIAGSIEHVRSGKLRALAVTTAARSPALPDVPTVSEFVPGFEAGDWLGLGAPKNTPPAIVDRLNNEIAAALADPKITARFADLGGTPLALTPAEFGTLLADETEKWAKVIRAAHIKPE
jgi:tripartite-type tricarboxylate transporter receptor subunit TctC